MSAPITVSAGSGFVCIISEKLPDDLLSTAICVLKFCNRYVGSEEEGKSIFDWSGFKNAIDNYSGSDLSFDKFQNATINQTQASVADMTKKIITALKGMLGISLSNDEAEVLAANVERTFTNLKMVKECGWANFSQSAHGSSSWEYRLLVILPNPDLTSFFYGLVTTIKLEADIKEESTWWGLESSSSKNFSARIDVMNLIVMKGFKDAGSVQKTSA
ncbi:delta-endotoxin CytB [Heliocybe sulcata]|uniref:Delta-endotoxin CytB n=1 Tax=Heliocybe sulcata TaxID=5364 RepID=A0A5C3N135_9AGAM|nr:delta-endotoxin CytB [Heliocybe sulcata]